MTLEESFNYTDEDPKGGVNLSDFLENHILCNEIIKSTTENRVRAGVQFTANLWYTAMIRAGLTIQPPTLVEPASGTSLTSDEPTLDWSPVNSVDFYDLQLASDNEFTTDVIIVKNVPTSSYTLENLPEGDWYWHVRSGDNSSHVGLWSQTWWFTVKTEEKRSPVSAIITITALFAIIIGVALYKRWRG